MNVVISKNKKLKEEIEKFLKRENKDVCISIKSDDKEKIKNSIVNFYLSDKSCFEDDNVVIVYFEVLKAKKENFKDLMKKEPNCIQIREKLANYENFIIEH